MKRLLHQNYCWLALSDYVNLFVNQHHKRYLLHQDKEMLTTKQTEKLANAFINGQFNYCPQILMFSRKKFQKKLIGFISELEEL